MKIKPFIAVNQKRHLKSIKVYVIFWLIILGTFPLSVYAQTVGNLTQKALRMGIPSAEVYLVINRAKASNISEEATAEMVETLIKAKENNIPVSAIVNKIVEGISKNVAPKMIIETANRLELAYRSANNVYNQIELKGLKTGELKDVIATAIFNGVSPDALNSLYKIVPHKSENYYLMGTLSLTYLIASGVGVKESVSFIKSEFEAHKDAERIQHDATKLIERSMNNKGLIMKQEMRNDHGEMNKIEMHTNPSDRMPINRDINMHNQRN